MRPDPTLGACMPDVCPSPPRLNSIVSVCAGQQQLRTEVRLTLRERCSAARTEPKVRYLRGSSAGHADLSTDQQSVVVGEPSDCRWTETVATSGESYRLPMGEIEMTVGMRGAGLAWFWVQPC